LNNQFKRQKKPNHRKKFKISYKQYSSQCQFKFKIDKYKNNFDVNLIETFGWYSKDNPNGMSRDHMLSISYGWRENISSKIIKHPANCQLMNYSDNHKKGYHSSITYKDLLKRIEEWDLIHKEK